MDINSNGRQNIQIAQKNAELVLEEAFAQDIIDLDEFEKRVMTLSNATNVSAIAMVIADLPEVEQIDNSQVGEKHGIRLNPILSSISLKGSKLKAKNLTVKPILGEVTLDYTKTVLPPGRYTININSLLSTVKIIVPPNVAVHTNVNLVIGSVQDHTLEPQRNPSHEIFITGRAILGEIKVKPKSEFAHLIDKVKNFLEIN